MAGDYAFTSGLTGTFTSDGTKLTTYNFTDPGGLVWATPLPPEVQLFNNNNIRFNAFNHNQSADIQIEWNINEVSGTGAGGFLTAFAFKTAPSNVPEPGGLGLVSLGLGFLALMDYVRRQRRQAGLQIG